MATRQRTTSETPAAAAEKPEKSRPRGEFDHLRDRRRFQREGDRTTDEPQDEKLAKGSRSTTRKRRAAPSGRPLRVGASLDAAASASVSVPAQPYVAAPPSEPARISGEPYTALVELSRMADRVIDSREQLAVQRARTDRAERELEQMNQRIMAARAIVYDAQRATKTATDRAAYLEGRCSALEESLDRVLQASLIDRLRWRRVLRRG